MLLYNIRKAKFAGKLIASGCANRWNKQDEFVIYTGSSVALSTLELWVHGGGIVGEDFKLLTIEADIAADDIMKIVQESLPENWRNIRSYPALQSLGSNWYKSGQYLMLQVPSAIVPKEFNFLLNTRHPNFASKVRIKTVEDYIWDGRLL